MNVSFRECKLQQPANFMFFFAVLHGDSDSKKILTTQAFVQSENSQTLQTKPLENATKKVQF